jgi:hypothetical protein
MAAFLTRLSRAPVSFTRGSCIIQREQGEAWLNLSRRHRDALRRLKLLLQAGVICILGADKNLGLVVLDTADYRARCIDELQKKHNLLHTPVSMAAPATWPQVDPDVDYDPGMHPKSRMGLARARGCIRTATSQHSPTA